MSTAYVIVTVVGAAMVAFSAGAVFLNADWVVQNLADYGVPRSWWGWLGAAKAAGAVGLLVGLFVPIIGVIAAIAVVLYFVGAVITVARARYYSHIVFPLVYMAPVLGALVLVFADSTVHA
jgi:DoxX-like protein